MPISTHQKPTGKAWKSRSNIRKDRNRDYDRVTLLEDGKLVEGWRKKTK